MSAFRSIPEFTDWVDGTKCFSPDGVEIIATAHDAGFTRLLYEKCLALFSKMHAIPSSPIRACKVLRTALSKLALWSDGFKEQDLDYLFDRTTDLRAMVVQLLATLGRILVQEAALTAGNSMLVHSVVDEKLLDDTREIQRILEQSNSILEVDQDGHSDFGSESDEEQDDGKDHQSLISSPILSMAPNIDHCVTCLMNLLPAMENLVECDIAAENPARPNMLEVSSMSFSHIQHIRDKFPRCSLELSKRIGEANWQRYLRIRDRIKNEPTETDSNAHGSIFTPVSLFHDSGYATTNVSTSSFMTTETQIGSRSFRVPETPSEVSDGIPFICFICGRKLNHIRNRIHWKLHVFADLRPYICTESNCEMSSNVFPTRMQWEQHEFHKHREKKGTNECPFCQRKFVSDHHGFSSHVARHMETISLAVLPSSEEPVIEETTSEKGSETPSEHVSEDLIVDHSLQDDVAQMIDNQLTTNLPPSHGSNLVNSGDEPTTAFDDTTESLRAALPDVISNHSDIPRGDSYSNPDDTKLEDEHRTKDAHGQGDRIAISPSDLRGRPGIEREEINIKLEELATTRPHPFSSSKGESSREAETNAVDETKVVSTVSARHELAPEIHDSSPQMQIPTQEPITVSETRSGEKEQLPTTSSSQFLPSQPNHEPSTSPLNKLRTILKPEPPTPVYFYVWYCVQCDGGIAMSESTFACVNPTCQSLRPKNIAWVLSSCQPNR